MKRLDLPGVAQHVVQRGNDRQACFFREVDYVRYLQDLREAALKYECHVHAYVLMTNHVHLLVTPAFVGAVSSLMQAVGRRCVRYINGSIGRTGTLWEGRYKSSLVDNERYRKLPRQAGISKIELSAYRMRYSAGVSPPSESCGRSSL